MKVKQLIEILKQSDGEKEVLASPMVEMNLVGDDSTANRTIRVPDINMLYEIAVACESRSINEQGFYGLHVSIGFDASTNLGVKPTPITEAETELLN